MPRRQNATSSVPLKMSRSRQNIIPNYGYELINTLRASRRSLQGSCRSLLATSQRAALDSQSKIVLQVEAAETLLPPDRLFKQSNVGVARPTSGSGEVVSIASFHNRRFFSSIESFLRPHLSEASTSATCTFAANGDPITKKAAWKLAFVSWSYSDTRDLSRKQVGRDQLTKEPCLSYGKGAASG